VEQSCLVLQLFRSSPSSTSYNYTTMPYILQHCCVGRAFFWDRYWALATPEAIKRVGVVRHKSRQNSELFTANRLT
jgi:hypothetical protein